MRFEIYILMIGCIVSFLAAPACSLIDEPEASGESAPLSRTRQAHGGGKADRGAPPPQCSFDRDCPTRPNTASWCSEQGQCHFTCEPGYGDANAEVDVDGCECAQSNGGVEACNGVDDDCDGVVDNLFTAGALAAGRSHSCAVDAHGRLTCWGAQQVDASSVAGDRTFWKLAAGARHSCALDASGQVYCWGSNRYGQRGPEPAGDRDEPTPLGDGLRYVDVTVGGYHSCGLTDAAKVYCWGRNDYGQLGDGTVSGRAEAEQIASTLDFVAVSAGEFHTCAATTTGEVLCWGANLSGQAGQLGDGAVNAPSPVGQHQLGQNQSGQHSSGVDGSSPAFVAVAAGANHSCALTAAGQAHCWGANSYGQGGDGSYSSGPQLRAVDTEAAFDSLNLGAAHSCGLTASGQVYCWGLEEHGRLGIEVPGEVAPRPRPIGAGLRFSKVSAGARHTCAVSTYGHLYCWGDGSQGQLVPQKVASSRRPMRVGCR
jgi:alpha-tubulin suppressor-like RCC1 family protein